MDNWPQSQTGYFGQDPTHNGPIAPGNPGIQPYNPIITPGSIDASTARSGTVGDMPYEMLTAKFDETAGGYNEEQYNDYARHLLIDRRPDAVAFEWERPRGAVNRSAGMVQFRLYGHRGDAEPAGHPEMFLDFTDPDPRGVATDPDMKKLTSDSWNRGRLQMFQKDDTPSVTGGGVNEGQIQEAKKRAATDMRGRINWFSRQLDGRVEGQRPAFGIKSTVEKQMTTDRPDDVIGPDAYTRSKPPAVILRKAIRNNAYWRTTTLDSDMAIAKYSTICKSAAPKLKNRVVDVNEQADRAESDPSQTRRMKAVLMSEIIALKRDAFAAPQDIAAGLQMEAQAKKTALATLDAAKILQDVVGDADFSTGDQSVMLKGGDGPKNYARGINEVTDHYAPTAIAMAALYKTLKPGAVRPHNGLTVTDVRAPNLAALETVARSVNHTRPIGADRKSVGDYYADGHDHPEVHVYKQNDMKRRKAYMNGVALNTESISSVARSGDGKRNTGGFNKNIRQEQKTKDNTQFDRRVAPLGSKYMTRSITRDSVASEMSDI